MNSASKKITALLEPLWARTHPCWNETDHPSASYDNRVRHWREMPLEMEKHSDHHTIRTAANYGPFRVMQCADCHEHYRVIEE